METEPLCPPEHVHRQPGVSPALLPQSPGRIQLTTARGQEVPLMLAGYRLKLGSTYHLRVAGPVRELRLVGFPRLLVRRQGEPHELADDPARGHCQALRIGRADLWSTVTSLGIHAEELEVEVVLEDGRKVAATIPVVLELSFTWKIVLLLMSWALLGSLCELGSAALREQKLELLASPWPWLKGLCLALLYPASTFLRRIYVLRRRAAELQQQFQRRWRKPPEETAASRDQPMGNADCGTEAGEVGCRMPEP